MRPWSWGEEEVSGQPDSVVSAPGEQYGSLSASLICFWVAAGEGHHRVLLCAFRRENTHHSRQEQVKGISCCTQPSTLAIALARANFSTLGLIWGSGFAIRAMGAQSVGQWGPSEKAGAPHLTLLLIDPPVPRGSQGLRRTSQCWPRIRITRGRGLKLFCRSNTSQSLGVGLWHDIL